METRSQADEERANFLETQVDEAKVIAEDADRKYEEVRTPHHRCLPTRVWTSPVWNQTPED